MLIRIRKHLHTSGPLRHRRVKAVATLFDGREVESRGVGDCLEELGMVQIIVGSGNCRVLLHDAKSELPAET